MKANLAKAKMLAGTPAYGFSLALGSSIVAEIMAGTDTDFLLLDNQHGTFGPDSTIATLTAMRHGATPYARVARNDYTMIGRLLDDGALGIVVPLVDSAEQASAAAAASRFPPYGSRSYGWGRAGRYGDDYTAWIDAEIFVAVQIESMQAVENAEAILATEGVDGCWIGPGDLALSLGIRPEEASDHAGHQEATAHVLAMCEQTGKIAGYATWSAEEALARAAQGYRFLTIGIDADLLESAARDEVRRLRR